MKLTFWSSDPYQIQMFMMCYSITTLKMQAKIRYKNNFVFVNFIDFYIFFHKIYLLDQYAFIYNYQNELMAMPEMNSLF